MSLLDAVLRYASYRAVTALRRGNGEDGGEGGGQEYERAIRVHYLIEHINSYLEDTKQMAKDNPENEREAIGVALSDLNPRYAPEYLRDTISEALADGKSMPTIGMAIRKHASVDLGDEHREPHGAVGSYSIWPCEVQLDGLEGSDPLTGLHSKDVYLELCEELEDDDIKKIVKGIDEEWCHPSQAVQFTRLNHNPTFKIHGSGILWVTVDLEAIRKDLGLPE